jgi:hypothetical protein
MRGAAARIVLAALVSWGSLAIGAGNVHAEDREDARRHLRGGVTLYNEGNYEAALVEFEASFAKLASAAALQNIALCQTKLFRYVEAIDTLERLQTSFGAALSQDESQSVEEALRNLSQLVGTLTLRVEPRSAWVTVDGRRLTPEELAQPLRLSSGRYRIEAGAANHVPKSQTVKVAGGEARTVRIDLQRAVGHLSVDVNDDDAVVLVDRVPLGRGGWEGDVLAGEHLLEVSKAGHRTVSTRVVVRTGDRMELRLPVGPEQEGADSTPGYDLAALPYRHGRKGRSPLEPDVGWYGSIMASHLAVLRSPDGFEADDDADVAGGSFGLRAGYRFGSYLALEGMYDAGSQSVSGTWEGARETYDLTARRVGGNVRLLLGGKSVRLTGAMGAGAVWHRLDLAGRAYAGTNSYLGLDLGPQFNVGQVLLDLVVQGYLEGANAARDGGDRIYTERTVLPQVGVGLRVGFSQWGTW